MTAFLVETTEARMLLFQAFQGCQRLTDAAQATLIGSDQVKNLAGITNIEGRGRCQGFRVPLLAGELADTRQFRLERNHGRFIGSQQAPPRQGVANVRESG